MKVLKENKLKKFEQDPGLKLKWNIVTDEVTVENVYVFQCESVEDALEWYQKGLKNRILRTHLLN